MAKILVVDDEPSSLSVLVTFLKNKNHEVISANSGVLALEWIRTATFDVVLTDIKMEPVNGMQVFHEVKKLAPATAVIFLTGFPEVKSAMQFMRDGAFDYVAKPYKLAELLLTVERAVNYHNLMTEKGGFTAQTSSKFHLENIIAESPGMRRVCDLIERVAPTDATVLILGESGTGKELVARAIHSSGLRKAFPFIVIKCAAMPEPLLESEIFGHVKDAFPGAVVEKEGAFATAKGGTIFLDEIGAMPLRIQEKFLQILQDKKIRKMGGTEVHKVDVRVIAATKESLEKKISKQQFREDLLNRINVIPIEIPPLRDRPEDILPLLTALIDKSRKPGQEYALDLNVQHILMAYGWPGNVRELENTVRHALTFSHGGQITERDLPACILESIGSVPSFNKILMAQIEEGRGKSLKAFLRGREKEYISLVIQKSGGDKERAAQTLHISLSTLDRKLAEEE